MERFEFERMIAGVPKAGFSITGAQSADQPVFSRINAELANS